MTLQSRAIRLSHNLAYDVTAVAMGVPYAVLGNIIPHSTYLMSETVNMTHPTLGVRMD